MAIGGFVLAVALNKQKKYDFQFIQTITTLKQFISAIKFKNRLFIIDTETESLKHHDLADGKPVS